MEVKKTQAVKLWNGEMGTVLYTIEKSACIKLDSGVVKTVRFDHIVEASNPESGSFEKAQARLKMLSKKKEELGKTWKVSVFSENNHVLASFLIEGKTAEEAETIASERAVKIGGYFDWGIQAIEGAVVETKTAGLPKEVQVDSKYSIGDTLIPAKNQDEGDIGEAIHILDVNPEDKVYIVEKRPRVEEKVRENSDTFGVRFEMPISELDKDAEWVRFAVKTVKAELTEEALDTMLAEKEKLLEKGMPRWFTLGLTEDVNTHYPAIEYVVAQSADPALSESYERYLYSIDEGVVKETMAHFREKGDNALADKLEEGNEKYEKDFAEKYWKLECLNSFDSGMSWGEWVENIWFYIEPWLLENGVSEEKVAALGDELSGNAPEDGEKKEAIKSPVRTHEDYGELPFKAKDLAKGSLDVTAVSAIGSGVSFEFGEESIAVFDKEGHLAMSLNLPEGFTKEVEAAFGNMVKTFGITKLEEMVSLKQGALAPSTSEKSAVLSRLEKKAARLGNWAFDKHSPNWTIEAGENGKRRLVRMK